MRNDSEEYIEGGNWTKESVKLVVENQEEIQINPEGGETTVINMNITYIDMEDHEAAALVEWLEDRFNLRRKK